MSDENLNKTPPERVPSDELVARWKTWRTDAAENGCNCDPPGSGEEWCLGTCFLSATGDALAARLAELSHVERVLEAMEVGQEVCVARRVDRFYAWTNTVTGIWSESGPNGFAALAALAEHLENP